MTIREDRPEDSSGQTDQSAQENSRLVHELRVHQIELEMQNEELRQAVISNINDRKHIEQELLQSEGCFQRFFENTAIGLYRTNPQGQILLANPAFMRMLGYESFEELAHRNLEENYLQPGYSRSHFRALFESQEEVKGLESAWMKQDGSLIYVRENARVVRDPAGQVLYYEGSVEDISGRKQAEAESQFKNILLSAIQETTIDGILVVDEKGHILTYNRRFVEMMGIPEKLVEDGLDEPVLHFVTTQVADPLAFVRRIEHLYSHIHETSQEELIMRNGQVFERYSAPMFGPDQRYFGRVWYFHDVTAVKQAQCTLQESEERYRRIVETSHEGIWVKDENDVTTYVNQRMADMLGYQPEEMIGMLITGFVPPEDLPEHNRQFEERRNGLSGQSERRYLCKDGSILWASISAVPLFDRQGNFTGGFGMLTNNTARKQAEQDLERERDLMKALMDTSPDSIYFKDTRLRFTRVSRATALREGFQKPELMVGKTDFDFFDPETAQAFYEQEMEIMRSERAVVNREQKGQRPGQAPRWFLVTELPLRDATGQVIGLFAISKDITDRKQAEQELERERDLMKALMDTSPDSIYFKDAQLRFLRVSRTTAQKEGFAQPELMIGKTDFDIFDHATAQKYYDQEMEIMASGQPMQNREEKGHLPDGTPRWYLDNEVPLRDATGQVTGVFAVSRDITQLKQIELDLERERDLMRALMDNIPDAIFFKDKQLRFFRVNKAAALKEGIQQPELMIGKTDFDFFARESAQEYYHLEMEIMRTGQPVVDLEQKEQRPDHPLTWGSTTEMPLYDAAGQMIGVFGITRDITGRKKIEQALIASEERLSLALDAANDGLWDWNVVTGQSYLSPHYYSMLGYAPDEFPSGEGVFEKIAHPDDLQMILQAQDDYLAGRRENYEVEFRALTRNREIMWIRSRGKLVEWDAEGRPLRMVGTHVDITQSKLIEAALRESEGLFRTLIDQAPMAINVSRAGVNLYVNQKLIQLFGFTDSESPVGRPSVEYYAPEYREESLERIQRRALGLPVPSEFELVGQRSDGTQFPMHLVIASVTLSDGPATVAFLTDISERKKAEEALRQSEAIYRKAIEGADAVPYQQVFPKGVQAGELRFTFIGEGIRQLTGYGPEEFTDEVFDSMVVESHMVGDLAACSMEEAVARVRSGAVPYWKCEWLLRTRDGKLRWVFEAAVDYYDEHGVVTSSIGLFQDITARKQHEREVEAIAAVSGALRSALTRAEMLPVILDQVMELFQAGGAALITPDPSSGQYTVEITRGGFEPVLHLSTPADSGVTESVLQSGKPYLNNNAMEDPLFSLSNQVQNARALAGVPLSVKGVSIGVLLVGRNTDITPADLRLMTSIADNAANALYRAALFEQTERRLKYISAVQQIDSAISSSMDLRVTFNVLLSRTLEQLHADAGDVLLLDPHMHRLEYLSGKGFLTPAVENTHLKVGECMAGRAALERRSVFVPNLATSTYPVRSGSQLAPEKFVAYHALPLIAKGEVKGVLEVYYRSAPTSEADALNLLETIGGQAAIAIDNAQMFQSLQRSNMDLILAYDATIEGWSHALDLRVKETEGHTHRVTELAERLAIAMRLSWEEQSQVRRGALLHDIGKMGIPDHILLKETPLTAEESAVMHRHPQLAFDMLSPIAYLRRALDIPYCHHERWDGTGYPRQLKGGQIPLAARIFSVVDVWDAITATGPDHPAFSTEQAIEYIRAGTGTLFDPQAVEAFIGMLGNG